MKEFFMLFTMKCFKLWKKWAQENYYFELVVGTEEGGVGEGLRVKWEVSEDSRWWKEKFRNGKLCWNLNIYRKILSVSVLTLQSFQEFSAKFRAGVLSVYRTKAVHLSFLGNWKTLKTFKISTTKLQTHPFSRKRRSSASQRANKMDCLEMFKAFLQL